MCSRASYNFALINNVSSGELQWQAMQKWRKIIRRFVDCFVSYWFNDMSGELLLSWDTENGQLQWVQSIYCTDDINVSCFSFSFHQKKTLDFFPVHSILIQIDNSFWLFLSESNEIEIDSRFPIHFLSNFLRLCCYFRRLKSIFFFLFFRCR